MDNQVLRDKLQQVWPTLPRLNHFDTDLEPYVYSKVPLQSVLYVQSYLSSLRDSIPFDLWSQKWLVPKTPESFHTITSLGMVENWLYTALVDLCLPTLQSLDSTPPKRYKFVVVGQLDNPYKVHLSRLLHYLRKYHPNVSSTWPHLLIEFLNKLSDTPGMGIPIGPEPSERLVQFYMSVLGDKIRTCLPDMVVSMKQSTGGVFVYCEDQDTANVVREIVVECCEAMSLSLHSLLITPQLLHDTKPLEYRVAPSPHDTYHILLKNVQTLTRPVYMDDSYIHDAIRHVSSNSKSWRFLLETSDFILTRFILSTVHKDTPLIVEYLQRIVDRNQFRYLTMLALKKAREIHVQLEFDYNACLPEVSCIFMQYRSLDAFQNDLSLYEDWIPWVKLKYLSQPFASQLKGFSERSLHPNERLALKSGHLDLLVDIESLFLPAPQKKDKLTKAVKNVASALDKLLREIEKY